MEETEVESSEGNGLIARFLYEFRIVFVIAPKRCACMGHLYPDLVMTPCFQVNMYGGQRIAVSVFGCSNGFVRKLCASGLRGVFGTYPGGVASSILYEVIDQSSARGR